MSTVGSLRSPPRELTEKSQSGDAVNAGGQ